MKLRDIIKLSCIMLNLDDVLSSDDLYDLSYDVTNESATLKDGTNLDKTFNMMIRCFNLAYSEIATDYINLTTVEEIEVSDGSYDLSNLTNKYYKIIKLENKNGVDEKCNIYDDKLIVKNGIYKLYYCYLPEFATLCSDINDFNGRIADRVFAYGLNKEYCYISGLYEEAESYKTKFEESLKSCKCIKKNLIMPKRRWF